MKVTRRQIAAVIDDLLEAGIKPEKVAKEVAAYLLDEGRIDEVAPITRDIIEHRAGRGIIEATVSSAHELGEINLKEVSEAVKKIHPTGKKLVLNKIINPSLIGGLKLNVINDQLDLSISAKLNRFRELTNQGGV